LGYRVCFYKYIYTLDVAVLANNMVKLLTLLGSPTNTLSIFLFFFCLASHIMAPLVHMTVEFNISVPLYQIEIAFSLEICGSNPGSGMGYPD
jgi:hypothetical protein